MGYTHYFAQNRDFSKADWKIVQEDISAIVGYVQHKCEVPLADGSGEIGTKPCVDSDSIWLNGVGDESHETFYIERKRAPSDWMAKGSSLCKTSRKPYDLVVTAILCYLDSITGKFHVASDGKGYNFIQGLEAARQALPRLANQLDIPKGVMENDRWCGPWTEVKAKGYSFNFCVDGRAYIMRARDNAIYAFLSHHEAAKWANSHIENHRSATGDRLLFKPYGAFDKARNDSIARAQKQILDHMIDWVGGENPERTKLKPPLFVRPGELPLMAEDAPFNYDFASLLAA
jgi:hypothetical protein